MGKKVRKSVLDVGASNARKYNQLAGGAISLSDIKKKIVGIGSAVKRKVVYEQQIPYRMRKSVQTWSAGRKEARATQAKSGEISRPSFQQFIPSRVSSPEFQTYAPSSGFDSGISGVTVTKSDIRREMTASPLLDSGRASSIALKRKMSLVEHPINVAPYEISNVQREYPMMSREDAWVEAMRRRKLSGTGETSLIQLNNQAYCKNGHYYTAGSHVIIRGGHTFCPECGAPMKGH